MNPARGYGPLWTVRALRPGGQLIVGTHRGYGDRRRTRRYGDIPVQWTTHLYQPEELMGLLTDAGLEIVAELRFPPAPPSQNPQIIVAARKPLAQWSPTGRPS